MLKKPAGIVEAFIPRPWRGTNTFQEACWAWRRLPVPVIAAVHGHCYGGGLQIALAADFRIATPDSEWSVLEGRWGIIPDMTGVRSLAELVGIDTAKRLTMTAQMFSGKEAHDLGLVTELAADPEAAPTTSLASSRRVRRTSSPRRSGCSTRPGPPRRGVPSRASASSSCSCCSTPTPRPPARRRSKKVAPQFGPRSR